LQLANGATFNIASNSRRSSKPRRTVAFIGHRIQIHGRPNSSGNLVCTALQVVDIFFVLSGFIMVVVAGKDIGVIQFLWRRAARIYPPYWVVSLVVLAISLVEPAWVNSSIHDPISLWRSFLLVPATTLPLLAVGWTLIHEVYFYLVFAILLALRVPILIGLLGWGSVLLVLAILGGDYLTSFPLGRVWTNPLTAEFMLGAAIGVRYDRKGGSAGVMGLATLVAAIVFVAPILQLAENRYLDAWRVVLFGIPAALIIYGLAASEQKAVQKPARLLVALGDWSYAIYLIGFVCDRSYRPCAGPRPVQSQASCS
jgi:exopolysaccharide production protein ExoZ